MPIRSKRIYDDATPDDGIRVLIMQYWPRGISKERAGTYKRALGPSRGLLRAFKDGAVDWPEYEARFLEEMATPDKRAEIAEIARLASAQTVTVMCACVDEAQCHRRLVRELVEQEMNAAASSVGVPA